MNIDGIGPVLSQRLIEAREFQPFQDWEDVIRRVRHNYQHEEGRALAEAYDATPV